MRARVIGVVVGAGMLLFRSTPAHADETPAHTDEEEGTRFHLAYEAPSSCPDRAAFLAAIRVRTRRPQLAAEGEAATTFAVTIEPAQAATIGRLEVRDPDGPPQRRTVSSRTCAEVTKALALVAALLLDPDAQEGDGTPAPPPPPPPEGLPPPAGVGPRRDRTQRPRASRPAPPPPKVLVVPGAELGATGAIGPTLGPAAGLFVDMNFAPGARSGAFRVAPSLRFGVAGAWTTRDLSSAYAQGGTQTYWSAGGIVRLCPVWLELARDVEVGPCAGVQVGIHHGSTTDTPNPSASTNLWVMPNAGASLGWVLSSAVTLELHGGAVLPLLRTRFFLAPNTTIFEVPTVSGAASLAARVRFW
jgi:hypothetical protein